MNTTIKGTIYLLIAAAIWGFALIAQKEGMTHLDAFSFTSIRCLLGGISMLPLVWWRTKRNTEEERAASEKLHWKGALQCGIFLTALMLLQQLGLPFTTVGKAAFITTLYIPITPLLERFTGKKIPRIIWLSGGVTMVGVYLLCFTDGLEGFSIGDLCMVGAAFAASLQMLSVDKWVKKVDAVKLSCYQFIVVGLICLPLTLIFSDITLDGILASWIPILYAGLCSCGFGYTFQVIGQKYTSAARTAILLSMETVFSLIAGLIFYREIMSPVEYLGCAVMFLGVVLSQKEN
ncbi:MAG: DMT family transporter [Firmicutes bacterium]|nr:DMT family transporter [Bacillota bacterium]